ncbi:DUF5808 domain-containing protein [Kineococcus endophyticus]|uniref:DUF5808 domain-containing protein n=1 Tax=Kineococcus endophyticus TaxID=1181883 RepID=A0ABV3P3Q9_9ACTN
MNHVGTTAIGVGACLLVGLTLLLLPSLSARTLPLGVSVPRERADAPVVRHAVRTYRTAVAVLTVVAALVAALVRSPEGVLPVTYGLLALGCAAFVLCRRPIRAAKTSEGWFREVPVRLTAPLGDVPRPPVAVHWYVLAAALVLATAAFGWTRYDTLPDPFPTHWDGDGRPDAFAARSVWSAFGPLLVAVGLTVLLAALASLVRRTPLRPRAGDADPLARPLATERAAQSLLGVVALLGAGLVCAVLLDGWLHPERLRWAGFTLVVFGAALAVTVLVTVLVTAVRSRAQGPAPEAGAAQAPDDDRLWRGGLLYVNREDPALLVPKRVGVGWTLNVGHPVGRALAIGLLVLVGAGLALAVVGTTLGS